MSRGRAAWTFYALATVSMTYVSYAIARDPPWPSAAWAAWLPMAGLVILFTLLLIHPLLVAHEGDLLGAITLARRRGEAVTRVDETLLGDVATLPELAHGIYPPLLAAEGLGAATHVDVRLRHHGGQLSFTVTDDGVGFDPTTTRPGHGTTNVADRLDALDGHLTITSTPGRGTDITGQIPARATKAAPPNGIGG